MGTLSRQQMLVLAAGLAFITTFVAYQLLFAQAKDTGGNSGVQPTGPKQILVAVRDIQPLELLQPSMFDLRPPSGKAPEGALTKLQQIDNRINLRFIAQGEPVQGADLVFPDPKYGMAFQIPPGARAMTVPVNSVSGLAGFLKPGNRVDVLATFDGGQGGAVTRTVIQDVIILAYGQRIQPTPKEGEKESTATKQEGTQTPLADTATLLVTPKQCEPLALAAAKAKLSLALRGAKDSAEVVQSAGAHESQVAGLPSGARPAPPIDAERRALMKQLAEERERSARLVAQQSASAQARPVEPPAVRHIVVIRGSRQELVAVPR